MSTSTEGVASFWDHTSIPISQRVTLEQRAARLLSSRAGIRMHGAGLLSSVCTLSYLSLYLREHRGHEDDRVLKHKTVWGSVSNGRKGQQPCVATSGRWRSCGCLFIRVAVQASEQHSQGQLGIMQKKVKHISLLCLPRWEYTFLKDFGLRDKLRKKHLHCLIISQHLKNAVGVCVLPV